MANSSGAPIPNGSELFEIDNCNDFDDAMLHEGSDQEDTESGSEDGDEDADADEESVGSDDAAESTGVEGHDAEMQIQGDADRRADGSSSKGSKEALKKSSRRRREAEERKHLIARLRAAFDIADEVSETEVLCYTADFSESAKRCSACNKFLF